VTEPYLPEGSVIIANYAEQHTYDILDSKKLLSTPHVVGAIFSLN
jgi:hypothetical protein